MLATGFLTFLVSRLFLTHAPHAQGSQPTLIIIATILGFGAVALALNQILSRAMYRPLREVANHTNGTPISHSADRTNDEPEDALEDLVRSLDNYRLASHILDSMSGGLVTLSPEGTLTSCNTQAARILGLQAAEPVGRHYTEIFPQNPDNRRFLNMLAEAFYNHHTFSSEEVTVRLASGEQLALGISLSALRDEKGFSLGLLLTFKDLAELNALRERMRRAQHLASLGKLAAGVAHEVRNPLASLRGLVELIEEDLPANDPKRRYTQTILHSIDDLDHLVEEMLTFANPAELDLAPCDLNAVVRDAVNFAASADSHGRVSLHQRYDPNLPRILADRERLLRATLNVVRNAFDATPQGGHVEITTESRHSLAGGVHKTTILIRCRNSGSYIPPDKRQMIFTPFYTTKKTGTGLGLPIAHEIVHAHGGHITVSSDHHTGTTFEIELPLERKPSPSISLPTTGSALA